MYQDFIAGCIAGGAGLLLGHPLDTVKARQQTMKGYNGIYDVCKKTIKNESCKGFYKGMFAPFISVGLLNSLLFSGYGVTLKWLHPNEPNVEHRKGLPMSEILAASIVGSLFQIGPAIPVELIKTKLQVQSTADKDPKTKFHGSIDCAKQLYRSGGIRALYQGGTIMAFRDLFGMLFYIPVYEMLYRKLHQLKMNETFAQMLSGGTAGSISWLSICPVEVIKNRIQTSSNLKESNVIRLIKTMAREEGIRSFYRGATVLVIRGFPVNALIFVVYARVKKSLENL